MRHLYYSVSLIEAAGLGEVGVDLYVGTIPADVEKGVMLRDPLIGIPIDEGMQDFYFTEFQVIVRDPDPAKGYEKAEAIARELTVADQESDEIYVRRMYPQTKPVSYPKGDADDIETSFLVRIAFGEK